ncbi:protein FAM13A-like isoform X2 [Physella acuta]|uniref:protein FAM13A-like isoform X2 n=1 Tax=Physella acuta TaxID=109671 RepID=UPI0027DC7074|nr:protein FAM13A-like isoform X2 [Physella acuta]
MDKIKNLISPRTRRKKLEYAAGDTGVSIVQAPRIFGVSLEDLMENAPEDAKVPPVVSRICEFIYKYGLDNVGLFRVSGSVKVVEKMRMQFEESGDVDLEQMNDVPATAGLLKVFLRDLPDTLVPERLTRTFFSLIQDTQISKEQLLSDLKKVLALMPSENYNLLKYITSLLVMVAKNEFDNKMSAYSLAILFGPNVFKYELTSGIDGLRDMDSSKDIMQLFISEFDKLFVENGQPSPKDFWEKLNKKKVPPPRPPPPKVQSLPIFSSPSAESITSMTSSISSTTLDYRPIPSPRKMKNLYDSSSGSDMEGQTPPKFSLHGSVPLFSPRDFEYTRAHSPFTLENDTHSIIESPMITARTNEFVEKTIVETISEHIFGRIDFNQNSGVQSPRSNSNFFDDIELIESSVDPHLDAPDTIKRKKHQISIRNSEMDETSEENNVQDFDDVERNNILTGHKKPQGPPRRTPSRKHRRSWEADTSNETLSTSHPSSNTSEVTQTQDLNHSLNHSQADRDKENEGKKQEGRLDRGDGSPTIKTKNMRRSDNKALLPQSLSLQNTQESSTNQTSPVSNGVMDHSPSNGIKLFIPPLDLSTLHEHIDGIEPIPISKKECSDTQIWIKTNHLMVSEDHVAVISPRSNKLKKQHEASLNTDIPPSPPVQQDLYKKYSDDDGTYRHRQITKKIQGLKKKIKTFEESFEKEHGYKPTHGEKATQPDIKKYMNELSKARKDLKRLKEETEKGNRSRHNSGASSSGVEQSPPVVPTVFTTLEYILQCLSDKRQECGRPEEVTQMTRDQVQEEKLAVQRALLHFESLHGRPTSKEDRDIMRPLYDRYRSVKRMLAKPMSPRNSLELQTVPEDQMMEIPRSFVRNPIHVHVPTADSEEDSNNHQESGTVDFGLVSRDFNVMRDLDLPASYSKGTDKGLQQAGGGGNEVKEDYGGGDAHLHELSLTELHAEIESSRKMKKHLRRLLREFEESFLQKNGRKVLKEDRHPLQTEYKDYKKVKARLRLLEALVLKHHESLNSPLRS